MRSDAKFAELTDLLMRLCDSQMGSRDWDRLEALLLDDPEAQDYYWRFIALDVDLGFRSSSVGLGSSGLPQTPKGEDQRPECVTRPSPLSPRLWRLAALPSSASGAPFCYTFALLVLAVGMLAAWRWTPPNGAVCDVTIAVPLGFAATGPGTVPGERQVPLIGRITRVNNCQWADPSTAGKVGDAVPLGRRFALTAGLLEITYNTGATVVLYGPVMYEAESVRGGFLALGRLTARIGEGDESGKVTASTDASPMAEIAGHQLFFVRTPTAVFSGKTGEVVVRVEDARSSSAYALRGHFQATAISAAAQIMVLGTKSPAATPTYVEQGKREEKKKSKEPGGHSNSRGT
jgi:hypothetical protein